MRLIEAALKGTRRYYKTACALAGSAALCAMVLSGALSTGGSVRSSLAAITEKRLGPVDFVLYRADRAFDADLDSRLSEAGLSRPSHTGIYLGAVLSNLDKRASASRVLGVGPNEPHPRPDEAWLNPWTASLLGASVGDTILVQVPKPAFLPAEAPMAAGPETAVLRLRVGKIRDEYPMRFALFADQDLPFLAIVDGETLAKRIGWRGRANLLTVQRGEGDSDDVRSALAKAWTLSDAGYRIDFLPDGSPVLETPRIFIEPSVARAVSQAFHVEGYLGYFIDAVTKENRGSPGVAGAPRAEPYAAPSSGSVSYIFTGAGDRSLVPAPDAGEAIITDWLAKDINAFKGDRIELSFRIPDNVGRLTERSAAFTVSSVIPVPEDPEIGALTPRFPGLADAVSCRDWHAGIPLDLSRVTPRDELYWDLHRATPRVFLNLVDAERIFATPFGVRTALRLNGGAAARDSGDGRTPAGATMESIGAAIRLAPEDSGFVLDDVRDVGLKSASQGVDFSGLFLGLSSVVIFAALLLGSLTLGLSLQRRSQEREILEALGWPHGRIRALVMMEVMLVALPAAAVGSALGLLYNALIIRGLNTIWKGASGVPIAADFSAVSAVYAFASSLALFACVALLQTRSRLRGRRGKEMDARPMHTRSCRRPAGGRSRRAVLPVFGTATSAVLAAVSAMVPSTVDTSVRWFIVGFLTLVSGAFGLWLLLSRYGRPDPIRTGLLMRFMHRRMGRSVGEASLLACAVFLTLGIGGYVPVAPDPLDQGSGTGGFSWFAQTSLPMTAAEIRSWTDGAGVGIRVRDGADASCLNLNKSQSPPVWGVDTALLAHRFGFDWPAIDRTLPDGSLPAVADSSVITWGLGKRIGDTMDYMDESGKTVRLELVGALKDSIFQGAVLVSERSFKLLYPSESGYRVLLLQDKDKTGVERLLQGRGASIESSGGRLSRFMAVESTYLSIFMVLGGLGVALGSTGFGLLCFRTLTEESRTFAVLEALGLPRGRLLSLSWGEHALAWLWGAASGNAAAAMALAPRVSLVDWRLWAVTAAIVWASGAVALSIAAFLIRPRGMDSLWVDA